MDRIPVLFRAVNDDLGLYGAAGQFCSYLIIGGKCGYKLVAYLANGEERDLTSAYAFCNKVMVFVKIGKVSLAVAEIVDQDVPVR